ncbi:MAG: hypothetical protein LC793_06975 [Thermomicrobia bacterium]|nr:hypothetical protein [Thermomicrobia bacterium]
MARIIAVFDDDVAILAMMRDALTGEGYDIVVETTADNALAIVLRERPALVILDFWMADRPAGLQTCSADRAALRDYADDWHALGCETLEKPFDLNDLLERVARLVNGMP